MILLDKIDRYIIRQFILTFFFAILAFVVIYIAVNLMETLDEFVDHNITTWMIIKYYLYFVPEIVQLVVPIAMLLASLFTIGRLDQSNELTAIRAAGRSMRRVALPSSEYWRAICAKLASPPTIFLRISAMRSRAALMLICGVVRSRMWRARCWV